MPRSGCSRASLCTVACNNHLFATFPSDQFTSLSVHKTATHLSTAFTSNCLFQIWSHSYLSLLQHVCFHFKHLISEADHHPETLSPAHWPNFLSLPRSHWGSPYFFTLNPSASQVQPPGYMLWFFSYPILFEVYSVNFSKVISNFPEVSNFIWFFLKLNQFIHT